MMILKELHISNCGFNAHSVDSMVCSQWQSTSKSTYYLIYRWLFAVFAAAAFIIPLYTQLQKISVEIYSIYLTHWGLTINMIVGIYGALLVTIWHSHTGYRS